MLGVTPAHFLKHYWQKKPLLVRGAFPGFKDPITPNELAGLSCEPDVTSRLVMERGGSKPWQVIPGPQRAARLKRLPPSHWTLLVQNVDRFIPEVSALLKSFRFIPDWRVEDIMISFAPRAGTVGPHIDSYDVFLLQGKGRRRWRLDSKAQRSLRPNLDLRILRRFNAEQDWILEAGDLLYLPPNLAHYGVALEECLTYSIGFRAPSAMDLLVAVQERLLQSEGADERYSDPHLRMSPHGGEIPRAAVGKMRVLVERAVRRMGTEDFDALVGELLTQPRGAALFSPRRYSPADVRFRLLKGLPWVRSPGSRLGFLRRGKAIDLFADGRRFPLGPHLAFAAPLLTDEWRLPASALTPHLHKRGFLRLLSELAGAGTFRLER